MDLNVLPTLCALTVFVLCFRPLVRRTGPHTNLWFAGWIFLLAHYGIVLVRSAAFVFPAEVWLIGSRWTSNLCALCFFLAASNGGTARPRRMFTLEIGVPLLLQSLLIGVGRHNVALRLLAGLLLLVPALHLAIVPRDRRRPFLEIAGAFALLGVVEAALFRTNPQTLEDTTLGTVFLSAAYLTYANAKRISRGVGVMVGGLTAWGLSYPLVATGWLWMDAQLLHATLDVSRYVTAGGMILWLLDEHLHRAESLALHDPLTGLPNRRLFDIRLDQAMRESTLTRTPVACLVIDVDKFKYINDTFGHPVGDGLLQALAKRLSWNLGPRDMLARTGGDEFTAILAEAADEHHVRFIAGAMMAAGCVPVSIQQHLIDVRISIGIAVAPRDATDNADLHRVADEAMYRAKRRGGGGVAFAHELMEEAQVV